MDGRAFNPLAPGIECLTGEVCCREREEHAGVSDRKRKQEWVGGVTASRADFRRDRPRWTNCAPEAENQADDSRKKYGNAFGNRP
jgi:hypothetical protein